MTSLTGINRHKQLRICQRESAQKLDSFLVVYFPIGEFKKTTEFLKIDAKKGGE